MVKMSVSPRKEVKENESEQGQSARQTFTEVHKPKIFKTLRQCMISKLKKNQPRIQLTKKELQKKLVQFIASKQQSIQDVSVSSCEFSCPICLEMYMTPCPTSCGHIFCYRCIDESIVRNSNCPSCRTFIRHEQFIESKPFANICHYFWLTSKQRNQYLQKYRANEKWLQNRRIKPTELKKDDRIDVRDTEYIWCKARILDIFTSEKKTELLINFSGWNQIYNEVININSQRLAPFGCFSDRKDIPTYQLNNPEDNIRSRIDYREPTDLVPDRDVNQLSGRNPRAQYRPRTYDALFISDRRRPVALFASGFLQGQQESGSGSGSSSSSNSSSDSVPASQEQEEVENEQAVEEENEMLSDDEYVEQQNYQFGVIPSESQNNHSDEYNLELEQEGDPQQQNIRDQPINLDDSVHESADPNSNNYLRQLFGRQHTYPVSSDSESSIQIQLVQPRNEQQGISSYLRQNEQDGSSSEMEQEHQSNWEARVGINEDESSSHRILNLLSPDHNTQFHNPEQEGGQIELKKQVEFIEQNKNNPEQRMRERPSQDIEQDPTNTNLNLSTKLN